jgi:hypothetical protein
LLPPPDCTKNRILANPSIQQNRPTIKGATEKEEKQKKGQKKGEN